MKIGELSRRTGVATRLLRYYEEQGLLTPSRHANGYRDYAEADLERVEQIRGLIQSGLTTKLVRVLIDMEGLGDGITPDCTRTVAQKFAVELRSIEDRIACLSKSRDSLREWLERSDHADVLTEQAAA